MHVFRSAWVAFLAYHAWMAIVVLLARGSPRRTSLPRWITGGWSSRQALALAVFGAASGPLLVALWPIAERVPLSTMLAELGLGGASLWIFAAWYVTVHPVLEEAFWRGRLLSRARGLAGTDVAFAGYHLLVLPLFLLPHWAAIAFPLLAATAWFWRQVALRGGGLAVVIASHAAAGIATMAAAFWLLQK